MIIDADGQSYQQLNKTIREYARDGETILLKNVYGQRYIGCGMTQKLEIIIEGVPGNDLAAFMNGPRIVVEGNGQDGIGNTMNSGKVVIKGDAGDILGHSMRGDARIYVKGSVGYRTGIHIKSFQDQYPAIIIGGIVGDYLGEYMAGGIVVVLGNQNGSRKKDIVGRYVGTGMHGGALYIQGKVPEHKLCPEVAEVEITEEDRQKLTELLTDYAKELELEDIDPGEIIPRLTKLIPITTRPYGKLYAY